MKVNNKKFLLILIIVLFILIIIGGELLVNRAMKTDFTNKNLPPQIGYIFGTDWMGRDMFSRTLAGLSVSIRIGILTAVISSGIAIILGIASATMGKGIDVLIGYFTDLVMGIPHILLLILISIAFGRGFIGVVIGISLTHWTKLSRILRGEVLQLQEAVYIKSAKKLGVKKWDIIRRHIFPHIFPQFITGLILILPHAILHEASITFLGFGLSSEYPTIGGILSESMRYLAMGKWWLAVFPGIALVLSVLLFTIVGKLIRGKK